MVGRTGDASGVPRGGYAPAADKCMKNVANFGFFIYLLCE